MLRESEEVAAQHHGRRNNQQGLGHGGGGDDILGIERGQDGKCGMGWYLYGVNILLLFFNVSTQSNPYQEKSTSKILALSKEKILFR